MDKRNEGILTPRQLRYVFCHEGDNTAAARAAGYQHPKQAAAKLMRITAVRNAIRDKQAKAVAESGKQLGRKITKTDVLDRLLKLADVPISKTRGNMSGQVSALKSIAEIEGYLLSKSLNLDKMLHGKSETELEYFVTHGYFPTPETEAAC